MSFVSDDLAGLAFLPSFGIASFVEASIISMIHYGVVQKTNPIMQCSLFFGGLWLIFLFKEVTDAKDITAFFVSAVILFLGAILFSINTDA